MLKGCIVGFGEQAEIAHVPAFLEANIDIIACVDPLKSRLEVAKRLLPETAIYGKLEEALREQRLDFLDICCPPIQRIDMIRSATDHSLDILCEKPLATKSQELRAIRQILNSSGCVMFPCHSWKYSIAYQTAKRLIDRGAIGKVLAIKMRTMRDKPSQGTLEWRPAWRLDKRISGGGVLMDHGYHRLYLLNWLLEEMPEKVAARLWKYPSGNDVDGSAFCRFYFSRLCAEVTLSWMSSTREVEDEIIGDIGRIIITDHKVAQQNKTANEFVLSDDFSSGSNHASWYIPLMKEFARNVRKREKSGLIEALAANEGVLLAYRSHDRRARLVSFEWPKSCMVGSAYN